MILVDSSGWLEYLADGPCADRYGEALADRSAVLTPTVVLYEVYKWVRRHRSEEAALRVAAQVCKTRLCDLDPTTALTAADLALDHGLAMADAIVYASGRLNDAEVLTSDADFQGLPGVRYLPK